MSSCRKTDIENYNYDMDRITSAMNYASALIGNTNDVRTTLDALKSEYKETLEATDAFLAEFANLDDGAASKASLIMTTLKGAHQTLYYLRQEAQADDRVYHSSRGESACC